MTGQYIGVFIILRVFTTFTVDFNVFFMRSPLRNNIIFHCAALLLLLLFNRRATWAFSINPKRIALPTAQFLYFVASQGHRMPITLPFLAEFQIGALVFPPNLWICSGYYYVNVGRQNCFLLCLFDEHNTLTICTYLLPIMFNINENLEEGQIIFLSAARHQIKLMIYRFFVCIVPVLFK